MDTRLKATIFNGKYSVPTHGSIVHNDNYYSPSSLSFESVESIEGFSDIHLHYSQDGENLTVFGGLDVKVDEKLGGNKYTVDSHERRLQEPMTKVFPKGKTALQIIKWVCKENNVNMGKCVKTKKKLGKLAFEKKKPIDICHQVATLEKNLIFIMNSDGLAQLKKIPSQEKGYVFNLSNVFDYDLGYDYSDIKTGVKVYGKSNKLLYSYNNKKMVAQYGVINEIVSDDSITTKSQAKSKGQAVFKEKKNPVFSGTIVLPGILPYLKGGSWCSFKAFSGGYRNFWIGNVTTTISNTERSQKLTLYDGKPAPPSDWIYNPPDTNKEGAVGNVKAVKGLPQEIADKANSLGSLEKVHDFVKAFRYEFYYCNNKKKGLSKTYSDRAGNCYDKNNLFKYMARQLGYTAHVKCGQNCKGYAHCVCFVNVNGQTWRYDTTCGGHKSRV